MNDRIIPEASELYPFYIVFQREDGRFDWALYPAKARQEAAAQFLLSGSNYSGIHLAAKEGYRNPYEYVDEDGIDVIIYRSEEEISILCEKLTEKDKKLGKIFNELRG